MPDTNHSHQFKRIDRALLRLTNMGLRMRASRVHRGIAGTGALLPTSAVIVFDQLEERSIGMSELGELMGLTLSGTSRLVQDLENKHLITRSPDECDRRATVLSLSDEGRRTAALLFSHREMTLNRVFASWPEEDVAQLGRLLERLETDVRAGVNQIDTQIPESTRESTSPSGA